MTRDEFKLELKMPFFYIHNYSMKENTAEPTNTPRLICAFSWPYDREILTICLKCRPTAWTGRSSRRGSNLGVGEGRGGEKFKHSEHYQHEDRRNVLTATPAFLDLIIRLKINKTSLCGWRVNETIYESCSQATLL